MTDAEYTARMYRAVFGLPEPPMAPLPLSPELARLEELVERSAVEPVTADEYCEALRAYLATVKPIKVIR